MVSHWMLFKCNEKLLGGFKQDRNESIFIFYKFNLLCGRKIQGEWVRNYEEWGFDFTRPGGKWWGLVSVNGVGDSENVLVGETDLGVRPSELADGRKERGQKMIPVFLSWATTQKVVLWSVGDMWLRWYEKQEFCFGIGESDMLVWDALRYTNLELSEKLETKIWKYCYIIIFKNSRLSKLL